MLMWLNLWTLYKGEQLFQVQSGRPPGNKEVMYDDMGNVVAVIKLNPEKLPSHKYVCYFNSKNITYLPVFLFLI